MTDQPERSPTSQTGTLGILSIALALFVIWLLRYVLLPFVIAGALAFIAGPLIRWIQRRWNWPRWVAGLAVFVLYLVVFAGLGYGTYREVTPEMKSVLSDLPDMLRQFLRTLF